MSCGKSPTPCLCGNCKLSIAFGDRKAPAGTTMPSVGIFQMHICVFVCVCVCVHSSAEMAPDISFSDLKCTHVYLSISD